MSNEKKLWLCEQYAHKAWTISLVLAQEAARAGAPGKGYAVVASEARHLAEKLFEYTASKRFDNNGLDFAGIADFAVVLKLLATNSTIEINRVAETNTEYNVPNSMLVFADEMLRLASDINELAGERVWDKPFTIPELKNPSGSNAVTRFFKYSIGGFPLVENLGNICELLYASRSDIEKESFCPRGHETSVLNFFKRFDLPYEKSFFKDHQLVMIVLPEGNVYGDKIAVPIDEIDLNAIFSSRYGVAVPAKADHIFTEYARECWETVGDGQLVFIDWVKANIV